MLRNLMLLLFAAGAAALALPFLVSSLYVDQRGITIPGRVYSKSESVTTRYSEWSRTCEITVEYSPPDSASVATFRAGLDPGSYDGFHTGQKVEIHYLRARDTPDLPMANFLRQLHALPTARLADRDTFSGLKGSIERNFVLCSAVAGSFLLLFLWRRAGVRGFWWGVGVCVLAGFTALLVAQFPRPTRRPVSELRRATGRVKSVDWIDRLFEGSRQRGLDAAQSIEVVGIEFIPESRTDPVVAVDLIDAVSGLKVGAAAGIEYERDSPRTAQIQDAARTFAIRNLKGIFFDISMYVAVMIALLVGAHYLGKGWNRLVLRR